VFIPKT